ncbi:GspE/PulE family protein [Wolinella succinogenes]|uniref:PUTATIVE TYPE II PROTEIN SECRETION E n=1 Tax=Wolinella succinogenes (strain ATCC 29543 / DSM 1740 / CCUG 13145 / JCM 31913 / LMG 7466 / NCTC 11488 / FDC 602W) TaxID=273121 RepID=Q7MA09_WOLSU|nr:GspE/PulE family protein [Wolinella succinogenes]CAE09678.1 PUTATIVE TYPE II PROTEIN SECRETION E [Wolinella succinogenes]VEG81893.1 Type II traffic warden ATPase [Wolinella succinogenes]HCZ19299.1 type II/IV secretion system protein [Helicobacter sp.]
MIKQRIGDRLIDAGLITKEQLEGALKEQQKQQKRKKIVRVLVDLGFLDEGNLLDFFVEQCKMGHLELESIIEDFPASEEEILQQVAKKLEMEFVDLDQVAIDPLVVEYTPFAQIKRLYAFPFKESEREITVVLINPFDLNVKETFQRLIRKKPLNYAIARKEQFIAALSRLELNDGIKDLVARIRREIKSGAGDTGDDSSSITKLIEVVFSYAISQRASDVHIEANELSCVVRIRIDGIMTESFRFDKDLFAPLASRIKLLSNLDIAEKRKPQDGRFSSVFEGREYDFRVSTLPIITGESIVARILDKSKVLVELEQLGISPLNYERFKKTIKAPYGIVFVTGPTGSGKTTTLYAAINAIKSVAQKIITVEDPVEYQMGLIQQVMVNEKAGLTFAGALRSILRQDPDIIMVGEIRDKETLQIAIQAALTGHLVLSTLHTNDAISGITRLLDMGIENFFIGSAISGIQAQRLVRKLCPHCRYEVEIPQGLVEELKPYLPEDYRFYKSHGCKKCNMAGYMGREVISEVVMANEEIKRLIVNGASKDELLKEAKRDGFVSMFEDGLQKALAGVTSLDEVYRVAKLS